MAELQEERAELKRMLCADMIAKPFSELFSVCLLYTSDAADE
mgnify:CR=1 FL=1